MFLVATGAAIVASQATISATFSLIKQALALGCFPRVKVVHTSKIYPNQIYISDINWILMVLCVSVTAAFKNQNQIGNASGKICTSLIEFTVVAFLSGFTAKLLLHDMTGTAVAIVMLVTTFLMVLIMILVWRCHWILVIIFTVLSLIVEGTYFTSVLFKVNQGGWVPLVIAAAFFIIMYVWHYGLKKRYEFEMHSKVSMAWILGLGPSLGLARVPGVGLVYTELTRGVPLIFSHFITNLPAIHSVVVFVCLKYLPVYTVPEEERFLIKRIGPKNYHMFRCVVRYGYKDLHKKDDDFEKMLFDSLYMYVRVEYMMEECTETEPSTLDDQEATRCSRDDALLEVHENGSTTLSSIVDCTISSVESIMPPESPEADSNIVRGHFPRGPRVRKMEIEEIEFLDSCRATGVVHILGNTVVRARRDASFLKKLAIDYVYAFLRKICRENSVMFNVPHESLLNVGQVFYV